MSDNRDPNAREFESFCEGYLLGLSENQVDREQDLDFEMGNANFGFEQPSEALNALPMDPISFQPFIPVTGIQDNLLADLGAQEMNPMFPLPQPQPGPYDPATFCFHPLANLEFPQQPEIPGLPSVADPLFNQVAGFQAAGLPVGGFCFAPGYVPTPADLQVGGGIFFEARHVSTLSELAFPAGGPFLPTAADGFANDGSGVLRFDHSDESCDLALSEAGDEDVDHQEDNSDEREAAPRQAPAGLYLRHPGASIVLPGGIFDAMRSEGQPGM